MRTTSDTRYPKTQRIRIYTICDEELAEYSRIIRPGERIIIENRAARAGAITLIFPHLQPDQY